MAKKSHPTERNTELHESASNKGRKAKSQLLTKLISIIASVALVVSLCPVVALGASGAGTEADITLDLHSSEAKAYKNSDLIALIDGKKGVPDNYTTGSIVKSYYYYYFYLDNNLLNNARTQEANSDASMTLTAGDHSYRVDLMKLGWSGVETEEGSVFSGTLQVKVYNYLTVAVDSGFDAPTVLVNGEKATSDSNGRYKVYSTDTVQVVPAAKDGYTASQTSLGEDGGKISEDTEVSISYTQGATYSLNLEAGDGGTAKLDKSGKWAAGTTVTVTATPDEGHYVASATVNGLNVEGSFANDGSCKFTGTFKISEDSNVEVTFAKRVMTKNDTIAAVPYNASWGHGENIDATTLAALKQSIFAAVVAGSNPAGVTLSDVKIEYKSVNTNTGYAKVDEVWSDLGSVPEDGDGEWGISKYPYYGFAERWPATATELIRITWLGSDRYPEVSVEAEVTLGEIATIELNAPSGNNVYEIPMNGFYASYDQADALNEAIYDAVVLSSNHDGNYAITVYESGAVNGWYSIDNLKTGWGTNALAFGASRKARITWAGSSKYANATIEFDILPVESRLPTFIEKLNPIEVDEGNEEGKVATKDWFVSNSGGEISCDPSEVDLPAEGTATEPFEVEVSVAGTASYAPITQIVTVSVANPVYDPALSLVKSGVDSGATVELYSDKACTELVDASRVVPAGTYYLKAVPGEGCYVDAIESADAGVDVSDPSYKNTVAVAEVELAKAATEGSTYTITTSFEEHSTGIEEGKQISISVNGFEYDFGSRRASLEDAILEQLFGETVPEGYSVAWGNTELAMTSADEPVTITLDGTAQYPTVNSAVRVSVTEERPSAVIATESLSYDGYFTIASRVDAWVVDQIKATYGESATKIEIDSEWIKVKGDGFSDDLDGEEQTVTYEVVIPDSFNYVGSSKDIVVKAIGRVEASNVAVETIVGSGTADVSVLNGQASVKASPSWSDAWFVESVSYKVDGGVPIAVTGSFGDNGVFTGVFEAPNLSDADETQYDIAVTFGQHAVALNQDVAAVEYDPRNDSLDALLAKVYESAVDGSKATGASKVELAGGELNLENGSAGTENSFDITWGASADGRYPEVSTTVSVVVKEKLYPAEISVGEVQQVIADGTDDEDEIIEAAKAAVSKDERAGKDSYSIISYSPPLQGGEANAIVAVSVEGNNYCQGNSAEAIVPVKGEVLFGKVDLAVKGQDLGTVAKDGASYTATPNATSYVNSVTIDGIAIAEQDTRNWTFSAQPNSGEGLLALGVEPADVEVEVSFAERVIGVADGDVPFNWHKKASEQRDGIRAGVLELISSAPAGASKDEAELSAYNSGVFGVLAGWYDISTARSLDLFFNDTSESVKISYPAVGKYPAVETEITVTLKDSRNPSGLVDASLDPVGFVNTDEVVGYVKSAANAARYNPNGLEPVSVSLKDGSSLPDSCNSSNEVVYVVTFEGNESYQKGSCEVTFIATRLAEKCTVGLDASATAHGSVAIKQGASTVAPGVVGNVEGLVDVTVSVTPAAGWAVESITVIKISDGSEVALKDGIQYERAASLLGETRTASTVFRTAGDEGPETYTVLVEYSDTFMSLQNGTIVYCFDNDDKVVSPGDLKKMIFDAVYVDSAPEVDADDVTVSYAYVGIGGAKLYQSVTKSLSLEISGITHKFGQDGEETIKVSYVDNKYGTVEATATLTVFDSCYNNTVKVVEVNDNKNGSAKISAAIEDPTKTYAGTEYYKQETEYTVVVAPGNGAWSRPSSSAQYVESVVVKDAGGKIVDTSEIAYLPAEEIFGVKYAEPTARVNFETGLDQSYEVEVTYASIELKLLDSAEFEVYEGVNGAYVAKYPSAEEIAAAVVDGGSVLPEDGEASLSVSYSTNGGASYSSDLSALVGMDGKTVKIKVEYAFGAQNGNKYQNLVDTVDVKLVDPRAQTEISYVTPSESLAVKNGQNLEQAIREALDIKVKADGGEIEADVEVNLVDAGIDEETGERTFTVNLKYLGSPYADGVGYRPSEASLDVVVKDVPGDAYLIVENADESIVTVNRQSYADGISLPGKAGYEVCVKPCSGKAVESVTIVGADGEGVEIHNQKVSEITYSDTAATFKTPVLAEFATYTVKIEYADAAFAWNEDRTVAFRYGYDSVTSEDVYSAAVQTPGLEEPVGEREYEVSYLAREAGSVSINIPKISFEVLGKEVVLWQGGERDFSVTEKWLPVDASFDAIGVEDLEAKIAKIVEGAKAGSIADSASFFAEIESLIASEYFNCHEFGAGGDGSTETIRLSYSDEKWVIAASSTDVSIVDPRPVTVIEASDGEVSYGATESEILAALGATLKTANGDAVTGDIDVRTDISALKASSEPYTIVLSYAGSAEHRPCTAEARLTVNKAACSLDYDSQVVKYGTDYSFSLVKNPADVEIVEFVIGLDVADLSISEGSEIDGAAGVAYLRLPGLLSDVEGTFSLSELEELLDSIAGAGDGLAGTALDGVLGVDESTIAQIEGILNSVREALPSDIVIHINTKWNDGSARYPSNVGVYLAGAVTADSNYETAYTAGYLAIYPNGMKADLAWNIEDENGFITAAALGQYDLEAHVSRVYEGNLTAEELSSEVQELFFGIDVNGEFLLSTDSSDLTIGAYTELAYIADWGNTMYYAVPIARAFAVVADLVAVEFDGGPDQRFVYTGEPCGMTAIATSRDGVVMPSENISYKYLGVEGDVEFYNSPEPPTQAGAYTVIATYLDSELTYVGMGVGAMVIEPAEAAIEVADKEYLHDGQAVSVAEMVTVEPQGIGTAIVMASLSLEGTQQGGELSAATAVNIDFPANVDAFLKKMMGDKFDTGITVDSFLKDVDAVEAQLAELGIDESAIAEIMNILGRLPQDITLTFKSQSEVDPNAIGAYLVAGVVMDPNYRMVADTGYLLIAPEIADVVFVDDEGNTVGGLTRTYDGAAKPMTAVAYDEAGNVLTGGAMTYLYAGIESDVEGYLGTDAPTETGYYEVVATYLEYDNEGDLVCAGLGSGLLTVNPATAQVTVGNASHAYDGNPFDVSTMVSIDPAGTGLAVISAGVSSAEDFATAGLSAAVGTVNIDFPERIDAVLKNIVPDAYGEGINKDTLLTENLSAIQAKLAEYGYASEDFDALVSQIEEMRSVVNITFKDQADANPVDKGVYVVVGCVMDFNYVGEPDMGILVIGPDVASVEFEGAVDGVITVPYDGNPKSVVAKAFHEDASGSKAELTAGEMHYYYAGVTGAFEGYLDSKAPSKAGAYEVVAVYVERNDEGKITIVGVGACTLVIDRNSAEYSIEDVHACPDGTEKWVEVYGGANYPYELYAVIGEDGSINLIVPEDWEWAEGAPGAVQEQIPTIIEKLEEVAKDADEETASAISTLVMALGVAQMLDIDVNEPKPSDEGVYTVYGVAFGSSTKKPAADSGTLTIGHVEEAIAAVEPTCTEPGSTAGVKCVGECKQVLVAPEPVDALGHALLPMEVVEQATCTADGLKKAECWRDGCDYFESEAISKTGHSMSGWVVMKPAEVGVKGEEKSDCANCDYFETREIPALSDDSDNTGDNTGGNTGSGDNTGNTGGNTGGNDGGNGGAAVGGGGGGGGGDVEMVTTDFSTAQVALHVAVYNATALTPDIKVSCNGRPLTEGVDYEITWTDNVEVGTAKGVIKGIGAFTGERELRFNIVHLATDNSFADFNANSWYLKEGSGSFAGQRTLFMDYALATGLMGGYTSGGKATGFFGPHDSITRGQVATILYRAACAENGKLEAKYGSTTVAADYATEAAFEDAEGGKYYSAAINWAKDAGIITGDASTGYTTVRPNDPVSRQELAIMLARFANDGNVPDTQLSVEAAEGVIDVDDVASWAEDGMFWAVNNGVMGGTNNSDGTHSLNPQGSTERCEAAKMISVTMRDLA